MQTSFCQSRPRVTLHWRGKARVGRVCLAVLTAWMLTLSAVVDAQSAADFAELGRPYEQRFTPNEYRAYPQNFQVTQADTGHLFIGNVDGLLRFDARNWLLSPLPSGDLVRSARAIGDRVYVGSYDEFGYFPIEVDGLGQFLDLRKGLAEGIDGIGDIWDVNIAAGAVYFMSAQYLFRFTPPDSMHIWHSQTEFHTSFSVNDEILVRVEDEGLKRVVGDQLELMPGGAEFADKAIYEALPLQDGGVLVVTGDDGLLRYDPITGSLGELSGINNSQLIELQPYRGAVLFDGSLAVGTWSGHVIQLSANGDLQRVMKLSDYRLSSAFVDREAGLWLDSGPDLLRVELPSALTSFRAAEGLTGFVQDIERHAGQLFVATSMGLFVLQPAATPFEQAQFTRLPWFDAEVWDLVSFGESLLVATSSEVAELTDTAQSPYVIAEGINVRKVLPSDYHDQRVYLAAEEGLMVAERTAEGWQDWSVENVAWRLNSVVEEDASTLWVGSFGSGVIELKLDLDTGRVRSFRPLGQDHGLPIGTGDELAVVRLSDDIYVTSSEGLHQLRRDDDRTPQFSSATDLQIAEIDAPGYGVLLHEGPDLRVWSLSKRLGVSHRIGTEYRWQPLSHTQGPGEVAYAMLAEANGILWIGSSTGLIRYDTAFDEPRMPEYATWLTEAIGSKGPVLDGQLLAIDDFPIMVKAEMPGFRHGILPRIQYRLNDESWSAWQEDAQIRVDRLPPGDYRMQVRGGVLGGFARPANLDFRVEAPWYLKWWGLVLIGVTVIALLTVALVQYSSWRSRRLVRRNEELERLVSEATAELERKTSELETANAQLRDLANIDGLTGVGNRRKLDHHLDQCWQRAAEMEFPVSLVMVDIDNFKRFNDEFGHLRGDECLRTVAHELSRLSAREDDLVARYGGEEFLLVLYDMPLAAARSLAEAFRKRIERRFATSMGTSGFTVSAGVATIYPGADDRPLELLAQVDDALYQAKARGRNQVVALEMGRHGKKP